MYFADYYFTQKVYVCVWESCLVVSVYYLSYSCQLQRCSWIDRENYKCNPQTQRSIKIDKHMKVEWIFLHYFFLLYVCDRHNSPYALLTCNVSIRLANACFRYSAWRMRSKNWAYIAHNCCSARITYDYDVWIARMETFLSTYLFVSGINHFRR